MRRAICAAIVLAILVLSSRLPFVAVGEEPPSIPIHGVLNVFKVGDAVSLKDVNGRYEIRVFESNPESSGHHVSEVGNDYVVVLDNSGMTEIRIPVYSIRAIVVLKTAKK